MPRAAATRWDETAHAKLLRAILKTHPDMKLNYEALAEEWGDGMSAHTLRMQVFRMRKAGSAAGPASSPLKNEQSTPAGAEASSSFAPINTKSAPGTPSRGSSSKSKPVTPKGKGKGRATFEIGPAEDEDEEMLSEKLAPVPKKAVTPKAARAPAMAIAIPAIKKKGGSAADALLRMATRSPIRATASNVSSANDNDSSCPVSPGSSGSGIFHMELDAVKPKAKAQTAGPVATMGTNSNAAGAMNLPASKIFPITPTKKRTGPGISITTAGPAAGSGSGSGSPSKPNTPTSATKGGVKTGRVEKRVTEPRKTKSGVSYKAIGNPFLNMGEAFGDETAGPAADENEGKHIRRIMGQNVEDVLAENTDVTYFIPHEARPRPRG